jgi:dienelactone hydrolase
LKRLSALILLWSCASGGGQAPPPVLRLWAGLAPGQYHVGYRQPGDISVWYPAIDEGPYVRFRDYVPLLEDVDAFLHAQKVPDETIVGLFDSRMYARGEARSVPGRFPVVLIAQGNGQTAADQAVLAEFIASHGYVVATIPGPVVNDESQIGAKAEEQADALAKAMSVVGGWANADPGQVVVVGHSFGGRTMLLYAMRHDASAMASLDGALQPMPAMDLTRPLPPLLHLYESRDQWMKHDFEFIRSLRTSDLEIEHVESMRHAHFTTWGFASAAFPEIAKATKADAATARAVKSVAERVLRFLQQQRS